MRGRGWGVRGLLRLAPLTTNCWPEAPEGTGAGGRHPGTRGVAPPVSWPCVFCRVFRCLHFAARVARAPALGSTREARGGGGGGMAQGLGIRLLGSSPRPRVADGLHLQPFPGHDDWRAMTAAPSAPELIVADSPVRRSETVNIPPPP